MSVTAAITEGWILVNNDVQLRSQKRREVDIANKLVKGWLEQSDTSSLTIKQHFVGLTAFAEQTGDESASFTYGVGNGVSLSFSSTGGAKYLCTRDSISIEDHIDGEGWETQTWERADKWKIVPGSYYEDPIPEEPGDAYDPVTPTPDP